MENSRHLSRDEPIRILVGAVLHGVRLGQNFGLIDEGHERQSIGLAGHEPGVGDGAGLQLQHQPHAVEPALGRANRGVEGHFGAPRHDDQAVRLGAVRAGVPGIGGEHGEQALGFSRIAEHRLPGQPQREVLVAGFGGEGHGLQPKRAFAGGCRKLIDDAAREHFRGRQRANAPF